MPGPDYPFATWLDGCPKFKRPALCHIRVAILRTVDIRQPEDLIAYWSTIGRGCHYFISVTGAVIQATPERLMVRNCPRANSHHVPDRSSLSFFLQTRDDFPPWPPAQINALARVLNVSYLNHARFPVRDAAHNEPARHASPPMVDFPWLDLAALTVKGGTAWERLRQAAIEEGITDECDITALADEFSGTDQSGHIRPHTRKTPDSPL